MHTYSIKYELVLIANDCTFYELIFLWHLALQLKDYCTVRIYRVPKESLYSSWNRGSLLAQGENITFWNVDDIRNPCAVHNGLNKLESGHDIVAFPYVILRMNKRQVGNVLYRTIDQLVQTDLKREFMLGPFFMFKKSVFKKIGGFDEQFRIVGDFEWQIRAASCKSISTEIDNTLGGLFLHDGAGLSGCGHERHRVEQNVIYARYGMPEMKKEMSLAQERIYNGYDLENPLFNNFTDTTCNQVEHIPHGNHLALRFLRAYLRYTNK